MLLRNLIQRQRLCNHDTTKADNKKLFIGGRRGIFPLTKFHFSKSKILTRNNNRTLGELSSSFRAKDSAKSEMLIKRSLIHKELNFADIGILDNKEILVQWARFRWKIPKRATVDLIRQLKSSFENQKASFVIKSSIKIQMVFSLGKLKRQTVTDMKVNDPEVELEFDSFIESVVLSMGDEDLDPKSLTTVVHSLAKEYLFHETFYNQAIEQLQNNFKNFNEIDLNSLLFGLTRVIAGKNRVRQSKEKFDIF